ncbi:DUF4253 domain-containing protein [Actinotalea sp. AC32]|nr:DUF4253 domain-containing protein [Actinotalea sp. AC32]
MTWWRRLLGAGGGSDADADDGAQGDGRGGVPAGAGDPPADATGPASAAGGGRYPLAPAAADDVAALLAVAPDLGPVGELVTTGSGRRVLAVEADAADLLPLWHRMRDLHPTTGLWPVLIGPDPGDMFAALPGSGDDHDDAAELGRAAGLTVDDVWAEHGPDHDDPYAADARPPSALEPEDEPFGVARTRGIVALVPGAPWDAPAVLGWNGGCNVDVTPAEHAVVLRHWHERHGAELVGMDADQVMELLVARPPSTPDEALAVALEQYAYCPDSVAQGTGSVTDLARTHAPAGSWHLWWD